MARLGLSSLNGIKTKHIQSIGLCPPQHTQTAAIEDMGVNHSGFNITVTKKLLDSEDIVTRIRVDALQMNGGMYDSR